MKVSNEFKVGLFGAFALLALILGYNFLKGANLFSRSPHFYASYSKINGLNVANPVQVNGLNVGKVEELTINQNDSNRILVKVSISKDIQLPNNSIFRISSADLLGSKVIRLELGNSKTYAVSGDTLFGANEVSLMDDVARQIEPIKIKAEKVIMTIDSVLAQVKSLFDKNGKGGALTNTVIDLETTIHNIRTTTDQVNLMVKAESDRLDVILKNVSSITENLKKNNDAITHALNNIDKITDDLAKSDLKKTVDNANQAIADISVIIDKIKAGKGSLGMLVNDDKLYTNLQQSSADLDKLIIDLKANPKRYVSLSLFGGKDKKATNTTDNK